MLDFSTLLTEDIPAQEETTSYRQAELNSDMAEYKKQGRILAKKHGVSMRLEASVHSIDAKGLSNSQYEMRFNLLKYLCKHPNLTNTQYPLKTTWSLLTGEHWDSKVSRYPLGKLDKTRLKEVLKLAGIPKTGTLQTPSDLVRIVKEYHFKQETIRMAKVIAEQQKTIEQYEFQIDTLTSNLHYKGVTFRRVKRDYVATVGGIKLSVPIAAADKLTASLKAIDAILLSLSE